MRRIGLAAGATVGAFALAPAAAQAHNFVVNTLSDAAPNGCTTNPNGCTLRDAMTDANANGQADQITFASGLSGTVRLTQGPLVVGGSGGDANPVTVQGPGAGLVTISGDANDNGTPDAGDSQIFTVNYVASGSHPTLNLSGLTLSGGYSSATGGAVYLGGGAKLRVSNSTLSGSKAASGGAIGAEFAKYSSVSIQSSTISGNNTTASGGATFTDGRLTIANSTISDNHALSGGGALSAGQKYGPLSITDSTISGNTAAGQGGGIGAYSLAFAKYHATTQNQISNTTISNNTAGGTGGGLYLDGLSGSGSSFTVDHSTISGNDAGTTAQGGGIEIGYTIEGAFRTVDSTVSGNSANIGAGVAISTENLPQVSGGGSITFDNSTIASNTAATDGGGMYLGIYGPSGGPYTSSATIPLNSTIVGGNTASGASSDLDQADVATTGGFALAFSLVQAPGDGVLTQANSILNLDPQLGALGGNGGPTQTQLPSATSPALDAGSNPLALGTDQRGDPRTIDLSAPNAGDSTDIGAVEREAPPPVPAKKVKCKKKHKKKHKRSAESSKKKHKKHKKCKKKKHKKKKHH
jgi:hypothetical protein